MTSASLQTDEKSSQPARLAGRDEMNLAEFPIALLTDRAPKGQKTLYFEDSHGKLTVTSSDAYGLPTAADTDVLVGLIYLTKIKNNFSDVTVNFSRYELIKLLGWRDEGDSYKRLDLSFNRWGGVWLIYDKCWWNNRLKCYTDAKMHIIESIEIVDADARRKTQMSGQSGLPFSSFTWNRTFIESCQADNLRQLDLDTYFSLKSAISKRLYRFLGKRFYRQQDCSFDLNEIAFDRVGMSRNYADAYKIKEKLQPAIEELESIGFLRPLSPEERYTRVDRGHWTIRLSRQSPSAIAIPGRPDSNETSAAVEDDPIVNRLIERGVTASIARKLAADHQADQIERQMEVLDWKIEKKAKHVQENPAGYLVKSITDDYAIPKGFRSKEQRQKEQEAKAAKERDAAEERRRKDETAAAERAEQKAIADYREGLSAEQLREHEFAALAATDDETRATFEGMDRTFRKYMLSNLLNQHIRQLLGIASKTTEPE